MTLDDPQFLALLGDRKETYLPRFQRLLEKAKDDPALAKKTWGWNWMAFLFGGFWLLHHRLYGRGAAFLVASMFLPEVLGQPGYAAIFAGNIVLGLLGDALLFGHLRKQAVLRAQTANEVEQVRFDRWHAGRFVALPWIAFALFLVIAVLLDPGARRELAGIFGPTRSCSASETQDLLHSIALREFFEGRDQSFRALRLTRDDLTITFEDIREVATTSRKTSCAANIVVRASERLITDAAKSDVVKAVSVVGLDKGIRAPITYDLTTTDDGRTYAEVWGLNGRR